MDRRQHVRRVTDQRRSPAGHEAEVRAVMEARVTAWLQRKGLSRDTKYCSRCQQTLPIDCFGRNRSSADGYAERCRGCSAICAAEGLTRRKARLAIVGTQRIA